MSDNESLYFRKVSALWHSMESQHLTPVLVGGMALVILGSQRVTRDFDILVSFNDSTAEKILNIFYESGFELVSKFNNKGEVVRTINNKKVAGIRLKLDKPDSVFFYHHELRLKIDLLFDFPLPAHEVANRAHKIKVESRPMRIASIKDLIHMKELAYKDRLASTDAQDLEFLRKLLK